MQLDYFVTEKITELVQKLSKRVNLDAGCGNGKYSQFFKGPVLALDVDPKNLKMAKTKYDSVIQGSICYLPFKSNAFSFVLCGEVIEHLTKKEGENALDELERVSDNLLVTTPNRNRWFKILSRLVYRKENPEHISCWTAQALQKKMFDVHGCLGWVTAQKVPYIIRKIWNFIAWYFPELFGGDLIGIKKLSMFCACEE